MRQSISQLVAALLGSAPLPAVKKLRPLPPLPQESVLLIVAAPHPPRGRPSSVLGKASQLRAQSGNHDTMRCIVQQAATRPERRDPAACCALAEPRHYTRHCV